MNTTHPSPAERSLDQIRERLSREWKHLKATVRSTFERLTDEDVRAVDGRYDELSDRITRTYGYTPSRTEDEISRFLSEGGNSAPKTAAAVEAARGDHRGMGAEVGRDDRPTPAVNTPAEKPGRAH